MQPLDASDLTAWQAKAKTMSPGLYTQGLQLHELINLRCQALCSKTNSIAISQQAARCSERSQEYNSTVVGEDVNF
jgi:hypothetical protein